MAIQFSQLPGRHERHYRRRLRNALFPQAPMRLDTELLLEMQRLDHEELLVFLDELRMTVRRAIELRPNEGSELVLELKERLDRLYEVSAGLADDHAGNQAAIRRLLEVMMRNIERAAADDPRAIEELQQERAARAAHFELLEYPLVADLLHPQSTIAAAELAPSLLSSSEDELDAALRLFDLAQLSELSVDARRCLAASPHPPAQAAQRLEQILARLAALKQQMRLN